MTLLFSTRSKNWEKYVKTCENLVMGVQLFYENQNRRYTISE